jgi:hypothetical protein
VNRGSNENSNSARQAIPQHRPSVRSRHLVWQWTAITGFVIAYLVLEWISFIHEYKGLPLTPWNPGLGLAFACLILIGARYGIALFAGIIVAEIVVLQSNLEWAVIVAIAAIIASGYTFIATVIREQFRLDVGLTHLRDVIILLGAGFVGATLRHTTTGSGSAGGWRTRFRRHSLGCAHLYRGRCPRYCCHDAALVALCPPVA